MMSPMTLNPHKKIDNYVIIASLKIEPMGKLINRIPVSRLLISSFPGLAMRTHVKSRGKPRHLTSVLKALPGKLDIKRHSPSTLDSGNDNDGVEELIRKWWFWRGRVKDFVDVVIDNTEEKAKREKSKQCIISLT